MAAGVVRCKVQPRPRSSRPIGLLVGTDEFRLNVTMSQPLKVHVPAQHPDEIALALRELLVLPSIRKEPFYDDSSRKMIEAPKAFVAARVLLFPKRCKSSNFGTVEFLLQPVRQSMFSL